MRFGSRPNTGRFVGVESAEAVRSHSPVQRHAAARQAVACGAVARGVATWVDSLEARRLLAAFTVNPALPVDSTNFHLIADAVSAAGSTVETDDTIDVVAGAFAENLLINTPLTLKGAQFGVDARSRTGSETVVTGQIAIASANVTVDGLTVLNGSAGASAPAVSAIYVNAADAVVSNNIVTGAADGTGILAAETPLGTLTLTRNAVSGFTTGISSSGSGTLNITDSRIAQNLVGISIVGSATTATIAGSSILANTVEGVSIDLATLPGTSSVALNANTFNNPGVAQLSLRGGEAGIDAVTLNGNSATLNAGATFVNTIAATPVAGLSTTTFLLTRTIGEDTNVDIDLGVDGTNLNTIDSSSLSGSVATAGNVVTVTPAANFSGITTFTFTTTGGASGTVVLTVLPENDAPTIGTSAAISTPEDTAVAIAGITVNDVDSATLTVELSVPAGTGTLSIGGSGGTVTPSNGGRTQTIVGSIADVQARLAAVTFNPALNYHGTLDLSIVATDDAAPTPATANATQSLIVQSVDDAPVVATNAPLSVNEGQSVVLGAAQLHATDVDTAAASLVFTLQTVPAHGTLKRNGVALGAAGTFTQADIDTGLITFEHDGSETVADGFTFTLTDGTTALTGQSFVINVLSQNDAPTLSGDNAFTVNEAGSYVLSTADLSASDVDLPAQVLTFTVSGVTGGRLELIAAPGVAITMFTQTQLANGEVRYVHLGGENAAESITYSVSDGVASVGPQTIVITVNNVNDAPVASNGSITVTEDVAFTGTLSGSDVDSPILAFSIVDQPANGTVVLTDAATGAYTFTPAANFHGTTSFTFQISDGTAISNTATVTVTVTAVNDLPVGTPIAPVVVNEGLTATLALADVFSDADESDTPPDVLTYSLLGAPSFVSINPTTGVVTIAPGANDAGTYSFSAIARDSANATATETVSLTVNDVPNAPPVISNLPSTVSVGENIVVPVFDVEATDPDAGQTLTYSIVSGNAAGKFVIDPATGVITLTGALDAEVASQYTLTIRVSDAGPPSALFAEGVLIINVTDENDSPTTVTLAGPTTAIEGQSVTYTATALDADINAVLSYKWFLDGVEQTGVVGSTFTTSFNSESSHLIRVEVSDRGATAATDSITLTITDAPPTIVLSTSVPAVVEGVSFNLNIGPITDPGTGDVAALGQIAITWGDGTFTLINSTDNPALLATLLSGGTVSVPHVYADGSNLAKTITVTAYDGVHTYETSTSILANNAAPTGTFVAITPTVQSGAAAFVNWFGQTDVSPQDRQAGLRYTYVLDVNSDGIFNAGDILLAGDGTYENSTALSTFQIPGTTISTPGTYSVLGLLIDKDNTPFLTRQAFVTVTPGTFQVVSLGGDHSGFTMVFNRELNLSSLNVYDGTDLANDTADIILTRSTGQSIRGSLVLNAARNGFDFVVTGGILSQGTYTVRLNSNANAFKDLLGNLLDGDYNGIAGGNYIATFGVNAPPGPVLSTVDFSRGPGQVVDYIPGNTNSDLPVMMNSPIAVSSINFQLRYDTSLLTIRPMDTSDPNPANHIIDIVAGAGLPAGWAVDYSVASNGVFISLMKTTASAIDIPVGLRELVRVRATVPNNPAIYGKSQVLSFATIVVNGNASIEGTADRSVHKVVYLGDANFDGTVNIGDAGLIQSVVLNVATGFDAYPLIDPIIIVDSSRNSAVDSQDASNAAQSGFTGGRPADVPAFTPISIPVGVGADPTYRLPTQLAALPGQTVTVPLEIIDDARGIQSGQIRIQYDTSRLDLGALDVLAGPLIAAGWTVLTNVNDAEGWIEVAFYNGTPLAGGSALTGTLLNFQFHVLSNAGDGVLPLAIATPVNTPGSPTIFYDRFGGILATSSVSGSLLIDQQVPAVASASFSFAGTGQSITVVFSEDVSASLAAGDFELLNLTTNTVVSLVLQSISADGKTAVLTFANTGGLTNAILKDGDYRLRVRAGEVADASGHVLPSDSDTSFFFMNADLNHDRTVGFADLLLLAQNYGRTSGVTFSVGDVNYDGVVSFADLLALAQRYGVSLAVAVPSTSAVAKKRSTWSDTVIA